MYNTTAHENSITIRLAGAGDAGALGRLAERDSAVVPAGELLVAFVGSQLRAAISIRSGETVADPFHPTGELVALLGERAGQLRGGPGAAGLRARLRRRSRARRARLSPQPAGTLRAFD